MNPAIIPAEWRHIGAIARGMRACDRRECAAMGHGPKQALRLGLQASDQAFTVMIDGRPAAMFGLVVRCALTGEAVPWMLGTDALHRQARALLQQGPAIIERLRRSGRAQGRWRLSNWVAADNSRAIRLLRRWGVAVEDARVTRRGVDFHAFHLDGGDGREKETQECVNR
ncbi:hypothetical protein ACFOWT_13030 [Croceibacterium xixiisoli]|uniref:hypothetical protein n=1 Tax=Croceibacterium xixiisoli TaxID=1476466 RepID=UPI0019266514|nr:hypothetical protein [Croceibacterium xixiisoli]